ncbi:thiamine phosphate synthase [Chelativorans salis]|uniref:Thiamine phosphate synthase n=1 Tax=Chelativorans salis TaxID=2978478 RepID=A0ABT2LRW3_9HYPH|nr:thiamine phosphate synthase [Chelativorans sp. EGI FJ00035]MCT7377272.1 thiamine phosphate synthase [Chelativorans sp. EGI FJ00035]
MSEEETPNRCRIVLIAPPAGAGDAARIEAALSGGDIASLILPDYGADEAAFQDYAERLTPLAQARGIAVIIAGEPRTAARVQADGIHVEGSKSELADAVRKYQDRMVVGCGGAKTRDDALELGETQPDYIFFGRFGYDNKPEPHPRNLTLGGWWSQMISVPCIVLAGTDIRSVQAVAETGAEFVALGAAVFADGADPARMVTGANMLLDLHAPAFEDR